MNILSKIMTVFGRMGRHDNRSAHAVPPRDCPKPQPTEHPKSETELRHPAPTWNTELEQLFFDLLVQYDALDEYISEVENSVEGSKKPGIFRLPSCPTRVMCFTICMAPSGYGFWKGLEDRWHRILGHRDFERQAYVNDDNQVIWFGEVVGYMQAYGLNHVWGYIPAKQHGIVMEGVVDAIHEFVTLDKQRQRLKSHTDLDKPRAERRRFEEDPS